ncbi:hypothetical protein RUND412_001594 [Rhizina undulata]
MSVPTFNPTFPTSTSTTTTYETLSLSALKLRQQSQRMSLSQTFFLAHRARGKLCMEAAKQNHNLRLLVGHANLLDTLMIHLAEAERDQEGRFNNMVRGGEVQRESSQRWQPTIPEEDEEDDVSDEEEEYDDEEEQIACGSLATDYDSDSDTSSESDDDEMDYEYALTREYSHHKYSSTPRETVIGIAEVDAEYDDDNLEEPEEAEEEDDGMYALTRTSSHRPPSLCSDISDDEDEESNPPSPVHPILHHTPLTRKERIQAVTTSYYEHHELPTSPATHEPYLEEAYFIPQSTRAMIDTF